MRHNATTTTDAYKITHWLQRPDGISKFMSYDEFRPGGQHKAVCWFSLQYILKEYFMTKVTTKDIERGYKRSLQTFGYDHYFPKAIWEKVRDLGYFPVKIKSVKEGTIVPVGNVNLTIESTEPWFANMVSHFEDYLMWTWYASGVATRGYNLRKNIAPAHEKSCDNPYYGFAVNDFGLRGAKFREAAAIGGAAHLIFFDGSDNLPAADLIEDYYGSEDILKSVWATEHSVATVWGPGRGELDYVLAQLNRSADDAFVSMVTDSYDDVNFMKNVACHPEVVKLVKARSGRTIWRPDSNDPLTNVCNYSEILGNTYGYHLNGKGYKVLNHNNGIIQGDGMNEDSIPEIFNEYIKTGFAAENFCTGSGGGLLDIGICRDTDRAAIKACHVVMNGKEVDVSKTPQSDLTKRSKAGRLKLHEVNGKFMTLQSSNTEGFDAYTDVLETVFENGKLVREQTFTEIREIAQSYL